MNTNATAQMVTSGGAGCGRKYNTRPATLKPLARDEKNATTEWEASHRAGLDAAIRKLFHTSELYRKVTVGNASILPGDVILTMSTTESVILRKIDFDEEAHRIKAEDTPA